MNVCESEDARVIELESVPEIRGIALEKSDE